MKLTKIELNNFGSYYGKNVLSIDVSDDNKQIVLIGGENGAGKTTLFTAIVLCLYGHYSFGYKNSGKVYTQKVYTYINDTAKLDEDGVLKKLVSEQICRCVNAGRTVFLFPRRRVIHR